MSEYPGCLGHLKRKVTLCSSHTLSSVDENISPHSITDMGYHILPAPHSSAPYFKLDAKLSPCLWFNLATTQGVNFFTSFHLVMHPLGESKGPQSASDSNLAAQFRGLFAPENNVPLLWLLAYVSSLPAERWMTWPDLPCEIKSSFCRPELLQSLDFSFPPFWATYF